MAMIGYARTSCIDQNIEPQVEALEAAGCTKIFREKVSGKNTERPELAKMLEFTRILSEEAPVTVVVTKLDRIGRSTIDMLSIVNGLNEKGIGFKALNNADLDTTSATGKLMLSIFSAVAQYEREIMLERQKDGIAAAKTEGKYKGRKATAAAKSSEIKALLAEGLTKEDVAKKLKIGVASVYRHCR